MITLSCALIAAFIHVYIFVLESILWEKPKTRKIFGVSEQDVVATKSLAMNQGFYNLFLSLAIVIGILMGNEGKILVHYAMGSILAAALVLIISKPKMKRGALIQGLPAVLYFLSLFIT
jgi:putative membrane protein